MRFSSARNLTGNTDNITINLSSKSVASLRNPSSFAMILRSNGFELATTGNGGCCQFVKGSFALFCKYRETRCQCCQFVTNQLVDWFQSDYGGCCQLLPVL